MGGGDRGGVPLGFFLQYVVSGGISPLEEKIGCVFWGCYPVTHDLITTLIPNTYTYVVAPFLTCFESVVRIVHLFGYYLIKRYFLF